METEDHVMNPENLTKKEADKQAKESAQDKLTQLHTIFDMYNNKELEDDTKLKPLLKIFQQEAKEAKEVVVFLYKKSNCAATRMYMIFTARILLRLSSLIHNDRVETAKERLEHIQRVKEKYGMGNLTAQEMVVDLGEDT